MICGLPPPPPIKNPGYAYVLSAFSRTVKIIDNNNIDVDDQGARLPSSQIFANQLNLYNWGKIQDFCPKTCDLWPSSNVIIYLM